ncbi:MAG: type II toxin-antitoxin system prevent-host-death family antitoxin [Candidatus Planktophila sp.]|nr:type II toxin-antitoxin system prevent-host-death family antitoxin [Candidatus Planktophila sp.]
MDKTQFETLTVSQATERGVSAILRQAYNGQPLIVEKHGTPVAAIIGISRFDELEELERDLRSASLVLARLASDRGKRSTLDEVIASLGYDREILEAELESELNAGMH